ncbi:MAG: chemotaxis protein CheD [Gammaproteobacteria bacterium]|nr:chemotaxis protein CheD [Gammaproteobacteria bacterium]
MEHGIRKIFLHPGEFVFAEPGTHVHTVLGSCIAICLWHPLLHIGGMCHFVLPQRSSNQQAADLDGRYGDEAMQLFDLAIRLHQTEYSQYHAKIFGGANMFGDRANPGGTRVGERNSARARQLLKNRNVQIEAVQVGEQGHRRIVMDVTTGDVWVKYKPENNGIAMASQSRIS